MSEYAVAFCAGRAKGAPARAAMTVRRVGIVGDCISSSEIFLQPAQQLLIKVTAVFALRDPVVLLFPYDEPAGDLQPLQHRPVLQRLIHVHPEIAPAYAHQDRRSEAPGIPDRILI